MSKLKKADGQDDQVFENLLAVIQDMAKLSNEQIALLSFECFHEARVRGAVEPE